MAWNALHRRGTNSKPTQSIYFISCHTASPRHPKLHTAKAPTADLLTLNNLRGTNNYFLPLRGTNTLMLFVWEFPLDSLQRRNFHWLGFAIKSKLVFRRHFSPSSSSGSGIVVLSYRPCSPASLIIWSHSSALKKSGISRKVKKKITILIN